MVWYSIAQCSICYYVISCYISLYYILVRLYCTYYAMFPRGASPRLSGRYPRRARSSRPPPAPVWGLCIYVCIYIYIYMYTALSLSISLSLYIYIYIYIYMYLIICPTIISTNTYNFERNLNFTPLALCIC